MKAETKEYKDFVASPDMIKIIDKMVTRKKHSVEILKSIEARVKGQILECQDQMMRGDNVFCFSDPLSKPMDLLLLQNTKLQVLNNVRGRKEGEKQKKRNKRRKRGGRKKQRWISNKVGHPIEVHSDKESDSLTDEMKDEEEEEEDEVHEDSFIKHQLP